MRALFFAVLLPLPVLAQDGPFAAQSGYYHDSLLPAQMSCPLSGLYLAADGQLLERGMGVSGVSTTGGHLCAWDGPTHAICTPGTMEDGVLVVPDTSGQGRSRRLTILPEGDLALTAPDGGGRPEVYRACPETFESMTPGATPEAFAAAPPPVRQADAADLPWAGYTRAPLPVEGVYVMFPRTQQSEAMVNMIANVPPAQLARMAAQQGLPEDQATPEAMIAALETEGCQTRPYVVTRSGQLLRLTIAGQDDKRARIDEVSTCLLADGTLSCTRSRKAGDGFLPSDDGFQFLWDARSDGGPRLCDPSRGIDDPNACAELISCPAEVSGIPVRTGGTVADLLDWWPGQ